MNLNAILIVAGLFLFYSMFSKYLEKTSFTAPMIFTACGVLLAFFWQGLLGTTGMNHGTVHILAEITLIFVLFVDAAQIKFQILRQDFVLPGRMLLIGMPLTIILGTVSAYFLFGIFSFWEAALLATILAPTDAALGQAVVTSPDVPVRIRQTLSVESGLNDGIALPFVLILASLASSLGESQGAWHWIEFSLLQVGLGPLVGILIGFIGAKAMDFFVGKAWISPSYEGIAALSLALVAFAGAELVHGNGFISAFAAGLAFGNFLSHRCRFLYEFAESEGKFFTLTTFLIFGSIAFSLIGQGFRWIYLVYAILSLSIIRMLPIAISLLGTGLNKYTVVFLGWFGPRGLASILFALLILEKIGITRSEELISIVMITVLLSILLHGISAVPAARKYGAMVSKDETCEEMKPVKELSG